LVFAASKGFKLYQIDINSIFLNGFIQEEVYVKKLLDFKHPKSPHKVYKLQKVLYGLKQALRV
ncbi:hypothetical protein NL487_28135, partial [Klebsiella pneumoniae]|nr:hypothetical protein [Klebsiella pneumoniae]